MSNQKLYCIIEGILFVSNEPVELAMIADIIEKNIDDTKEIMDELASAYENDNNRGIKLVQIENTYQFVTKPSIFDYVVKVHNDIEKPKISPAMLEVLAIIAFKQPITKLEIEKIRGVKSDNIVNKLIDYELVCEAGRSDKIGRPILFGTTNKFLVSFGLKDLKDLKKLESNE